MLFWIVVVRNQDKGAVFPQIWLGQQMLGDPSYSISSSRWKIALRYPNRFFNARGRYILLQQAWEKSVRATLNRAANLPRRVERALQKPRVEAPNCHARARNFPLFPFLARTASPSPA
jgi:hypothetical protein